LIGFRKEYNLTYGCSHPSICKVAGETDVKVICRWGMKQGSARSATGPNAAQARSITAQLLGGDILR
jgi:hypothetical protein